MPSYRIARESEEREIIDFSNMVFSMSACPTDFEKMYPAIYGKPGFSNLHMIARDEADQLVGSIAVKPMQLKLGDGNTLSLGYLGTVATHPRARGRGYMKQLMGMSIHRAREAGMELMVLNGQRQRYHHYDFESCGTVMRFHLNGINLRGMEEGAGYVFLPFDQADDRRLDAAYGLYQQLDMVGQRSRDDFAPILHTGGGKPYLVLRDGQTIGYLFACGHEIEEIACTQDVDLIRLSACWLTHQGCKNFRFTLPLHRKDAIRTLGQVAETWSIDDDMMVLVLNWASVLQKLMNHKARYQPLQDGERVIEVQGEALLRIRVSGGMPTVTALAAGSAACEISFTPREAVRHFLSSFGRLAEWDDPCFGWFPLLFTIPKPDWF